MKTIKKFLKTGEVAKELSVSKPTIIDWIRRGKVNSILTPNGTHLIPVSELDKLLSNSTGFTENYSKTSELPTNDLSTSEDKDKYITNSSRLEG